MMLWESAIANATGKTTMPYLIDHTTNVTGSTNYSAKTSYGDTIFSAEVAGELKQSCGKMDKTDTVISVIQSV